MLNPNGSDIRGARGLLRQALALGPTPVDSYIVNALAKMDRARPVRKAAAKHRGWADPTLKRDIQACLAAYPDWSLQQVSAYCNTNTARVSEVSTGLV